MRVELVCLCQRSTTDLGTKWLLPSRISSSDGKVGKTHTTLPFPDMSLDAIHSSLQVQGIGLALELVGVGICNLQNKV